MCSDGWLHRLFFTLDRLLPESYLRVLYCTCIPTWRFLGFPWWPFVRCLSGFFYACSVFSVWESTSVIAVVVVTWWRNRVERGSGNYCDIVVADGAVLVLELGSGTDIALKKKNE